MGKNLARLRSSKSPRDAVVETLISYCQISALKLFPLGWQRAIVGNILTLVTAVIFDFADGIQLSRTVRKNFDNSDPMNLSMPCGLLLKISANTDTGLLGDGWLGWLEKKIGGGILISQLSDLIERVVLTLIDKVWSGAWMKG